MFDRWAKPIYESPANIYDLRPQNQFTKSNEAICPVIKRARTACSNKCWLRGISSQTQAPCGTVSAFYLSITIVFLMSGQAITKWNDLDLGQCCLISLCVHSGFFETNTNEEAAWEIQKGFMERLQQVIGTDKTAGATKVWVSGNSSFKTWDWT